jgi:hypothetical protein
MNNCINKLTRDPTLPIPKVFREMVSGIKNDGLDLISKTPKFDNKKSGLYIQRNKAIGTSKTNFKKFEEIEIPPNYQSFLIADYKDKNTRILVFGPEWAIKLMGRAKYFFIDGTFRICPEPFLQLVTIHCDLESTMDYTNIVPLVYALLPNKKKDTYMILLDLLKTRIRDWEPLCVMIDFEISLRQAIQSFFHDVTIKGCYYHFINALWKKAKQLKLLKNNDKRRIVALAAALPLLPKEKINVGWEYIQSQMIPELSMEQFQKYFLKFWLKNDEFIEQWCMFGEKHRTNNYSEAWHFSINDKTSNKLTLFHLLKRLHLNATYQRNRYLAIENNFNKKKRDSAYITRDIIIQNTQMQLITGEITVEHFLDMIRR